MDWLAGMIEYPFLRNALLAALLASVSCGLTGAYVVSRRMVFLSGGVSHASFGGIGLAFFLGLHPPLGALAFAVLSALLIQYLADHQQIRNDSAIGIIWSVGMAAGIIFAYMTPGYVPNLMTYLIGNILTVGRSDLLLLLLSFALSIIAFIGFFPLVLAVSFDEQYARIRKVPAGLANYLLMVVVAITIVTSIRVAGVILVISYLTLPQAAAAVFTSRLSHMMLWSVLISITGSLSGLFISYVLDLPTGAVIIFTLAGIFIVLKGIRLFAGARQKRTVLPNNSRAENVNVKI